MRELYLQIGQIVHLRMHGLYNGRQQVPIRETRRHTRPTRQRQMADHEERRTAMNDRFTLDKIQQDEDILVWKYGLFVDFDDPNNTITEQDRQDYFRRGGMTSLAVVSYRKEHPYLDHAEKLKKAISILCDMTEEQIDGFLIQNTKNKRQRQEPSKQYGMQKLSAYSKEDYDEIAKRAFDEMQGYVEDFDKFLADKGKYLIFQDLVEPDKNKQQ